MLTIPQISWVHGTMLGVRLLSLNAPLRLTPGAVILQQDRLCFLRAWSTNEHLGAKTWG